MPNNALLPLIGCALVLSAVGTDYGLGRVDVAKPHRLPVETFPVNIGSWKGGPLESVDLDIQKQLPTAKIVERHYTSPAKQSIDLMLLTATEDEDMHSPQACFPSQGWTLSDIHDTQVDGQPATQMTATMNGGPPQTVLYWLTGYYPPAPPRNVLIRKVSLLRNHVVGGHNNMSLFVRIIVPSTPLARRSLTEFTSSLKAPLRLLVGAGANPSQKSLLHRGF